MVYNNSLTFSPYVESSSTKSNVSEEKEITLLREYFSKLNGSPHAFEDIQPLLPELFHPDFKMIVSSKTGSSEMELSYDQFIAILIKFCDGGCVASLERAEKNHNEETVTCIINNILPNEIGDTTEQIAYYKDGKIIRVEAIPADSLKFRSMIDRVVDLPATEDDVLEKFRALLEISGDESSNTFERVKPLADEIFDPNAVFELSDSEKQDYDWFLRFLASVSKEGISAKLEELERINDSGEIKAVIHSFVNGEDMGSGERRMLVENNKIVYFKHVSPVDEQQFHKLTDRTMTSYPEKDQNDELIEKYRAFISAFDGSPGAFDKARPFMDDIFDRDTLIIRTGQGEEGKNYAWFLDFATTFAGDRNVARIVELEQTDTGLRTVIHNTVKGKDMGTAEQRGIVKNGKIVYWEAVPSAEKDFTAMVNHVMSE